jgi:hypothetical protein
VRERRRHRSSGQLASTIVGSEWGPATFAWVAIGVLFGSFLAFLGLKRSGFQLVDLAQKGFEQPACAQRGTRAVLRATS